MTRTLRTLFLVALASLAACRASAPTGASPAGPPTDQPRQTQVGFLLIDGIYNTELTAPYDIFQHTVFHTEPGMRVFTVGRTLDPVTTFEGLRILPDYSFDNVPPIDVLVVASAEHNMDTDLEDERLIEFVRNTGQAAQTVLSLCDGAFVLARAGLLEGRQATTFPSDIKRMRAMFPELEVLDGPSFVHDGPLITSVGGAPSFEAALYLCEQLYGARAARGIAGGLVIDWDLGTIDHVVVP